MRSCSMYRPVQYLASGAFMIDCFSLASTIYQQLFSKAQRSLDLILKMGESKDAERWRSVTSKTS